MRMLAAVVVLLGTGAAAADDVQRRPSVSYGKPIVTGTYDAKVLTAVVKKSQRKYLACYTKALAAAPELAGTANATFTLTGDGKITNVAVSGLGEVVDKCVAAVVAKLQLPKPKGRVAIEITYPLAFENVMVGGAFASLTGTGDISSGFDDTNIYGGLRGDRIGDASGGAGGFGTGTGTISTGRYGTIGQGSGTGSGYGTGGGMRSREPSASLSIGKPTVVGDLDVAIVRRYIRRNLQKLLYCYEKERLAKPALQGTITTDFTIGPDGLVKSTTAAGFDRTVEACVVSVIERIEFPKPRGASEVKVTYPFTYHPPPPPATKPPEAAQKPRPAKSEPAPSR